VAAWRRPYDDRRRLGVGNGKRGPGRDHLYSVAALTSNTGAVLERYRYDAYGQRTVLAADGTTVRAASSYGNQVGFTGRYLDKETSLWYFRARYYSGSLGRFISRDPWKYVDGYSLYPAYFVPLALDPTGLAVDPCAPSPDTEMEVHTGNAAFDVWYRAEYGCMKEPKVVDADVDGVGGGMSPFGFTVGWSFELKAPRLGDIQKEASCLDGRWSVYYTGNFRARVLGKFGFGSFSYSKSVNVIKAFTTPPKDCGCCDDGKNSKIGEGANTYFDDELQRAIQRAL
jgi:RHS repeat-associated protein